MCFTISTVCANTEFTVFFSFLSSFTNPFRPPEDLLTLAFVFLFTNPVWRRRFLLVLLVQSMRPKGPISAAKSIR